jgi:glycosyltransferase involved in cell wall biosynthesis
MIKLSLIIPYYNTYEYTVKLLKELQLQITDEVEVILIDDGCNEDRLDIFQAPNFHILHFMKHKGACAAWNVGIEEAQGKYIGFIDSDDMIMMNYIEELLNAIDKDLADEIMFDWVDFDENMVIIHPTARAIWKAIYRREIVPFFDETYVHHTDVPFQNRLREIPHTQCRLCKPLYVYRSKRVGSITDLRLQGLLKNPDEL